MQIYIYNGTTKHNLIGDILDNGTPLFSGGEDAELPIADSSYRFSEIMGDDNVVVNFSMPVFFDFPIGCRINVDYTEYTLVELGNVTKQNERWYDYTLTFESPAKQLSRYKFRNHVDGRLNFTLTAQPLEFLTHIITNLNQREGANNWMLGDCIVSSEKTQSFSHNTILDALNAVVQLFETEWEINGKTISLKKVEYNKANPITLSYGRGNGFKSGIARQLSGEKAVDVLWVEGGDRNIDSQTYTYQKTISGQTQTLHANKLRLPRNAQFVYIPSDNEPDQYGNIDRGTIFTLAAWNALTPEQRAQYTDYMQVYTDEDGFGVFRSAYINNGYEESLEATDIYPKKVLTVTAVTESNPSNHFWEIQAVDNDVDYANCIIGGEDATIIFQSGMLTGKEFNWSKYTHSTKQFDIVPQEIDGITMPDRSSGYMPAVGDTFAVFHIALPQQYITNAEQELLLTACEYLYKHGEVEVEFNGTVDEIWAKNNWDALVPYFKVGGYIRFTDSKLVTEGKLMRILSIKTYLNNPHSPEITLSNSSVSQSVSNELKKIPQNQVYQHNELQQQISYTQRSFRDTKETQKALEEAIENIDTDFTESISPVSVQTMQMIVGSDNLQFAFGTATTTPQSGKQKVTGFTVQTWNPTYANGSLICTATHLKHYTIASNNVTSGDGSVSKYPYWSVSSANLTPSDPDKFYYLYAVCPKSGTSSANLGYLTSSAYFTLSETPQSHTSANYFMLVGILNKQREGSRSFASMYGYTEITGNRITTDRIISADGNTFFDLVNNEIRGNIIFTAPSGSENKQLIDSIINSNSTVTTASSNASSAVSTANAANSTANTANTNASAAVSTANGAQSTANTANSNASAAVTTANGATATANAAAAKADAIDTATAALRSAMSGTTEVSGGLMLTNVIMLKNASNAVNAGVSGLNQSTAGKNPRFWAGGNWTQATEAAQQAVNDIPSQTVPILLTDTGINSNIGIFKVLDGAIAVMRNGQVVRISTAAFSTEQTSFAPAAPFNHTLSSGGRLNFTSTSYSQASHTRDFTGLFDKTANYNITIAQTSVKLLINENRTTYFSGSCTVTLTVTLQIKAGNKIQTIYTGSITRTQSSVSSGSTYPFENSQTLTVPATSVNNVQITAGNRIQLIATLSSSATGSTAVTSRADYYELAAQMVATNSENNSCFILANGGFECAYSATKALFFNAINGLFSFQGSNFTINGKDFAVDKTKSVTLGNGSLQLQRIGFLVTVKITIPKAYLASSGVIPTGYRPSIATTVLVCTAAADGTVYQLDISTGGGMTCGSLPNNTIAYGSATYICTESYPS